MAASGWAVPVVVAPQAVTLDVCLLHPDSAKVRLVAPTLAQARLHGGPPKYPVDAPVLQIHLFHPSPADAKIDSARCNTYFTTNLLAPRLAQPVPVRALVPN